MRPFLLGSRATIFMLHRFSHLDGNSGGITPDALRGSLIFLRRNNFALIPLSEMLAKLRSGTPLPRFSISFTVDDGYADFVDTALPVFKEFDCPATVFLTTGFLDNTTWLWWDKLQYAFLRTSRRSCMYETDGLKVELTFGSRDERVLLADRFAERLKGIPDETKHMIISEIATVLGVKIPTRCPPEYRPMTWDDVRACERHGINFGPHTVTHPILSQVTDRVARSEIAESWKRIQQETAAAVPVLCYPNGNAASFGPREIRIAQEVGLKAAVTSRQDHVFPEEISGGAPQAFYQIPRFPYSEFIESLAQVVSGVERLKAGIRAYTTEHAGARAIT
jgi:peptidoglycan/xylan/chitin deacetylase (PgdA/CDA1 family)